MSRELLQLAEERARQKEGIYEQQQVAQILEQEGERQKRAEQERRAEEERLRLADQESQRQAEEERHRQTEQELFEADDTEETRTTKEPELTSAQRDRERPATLSKPSGVGTRREKNKPPRGIGATRRENNRKRATQIDLGESIEPRSDLQEIGEQQQTQLAIQDEPEREMLAKERQKQAEAEMQQQAEEAERQRQAEEAERQRQAEEAERQRQAEEERKSLTKKRLRVAEQESEKEDDIQDKRTIKRQKYLAKAQPDREKQLRKKPRPPRGIGATRRENKRITQIDLGKAIEPTTGRQAEKDQVELDAADSSQQKDAQRVPITFKIYAEGIWRVERIIPVDRSNPLEVNEIERQAIRHITKYDGIQIYDTNLRKLDPRTCFEDVTADGTNTILLIPESEKDAIEFPDNEPQAGSAAGQPKPASNFQRKKGRLEF
ncbi:hypothetical protein K458DRAFT_399676 [Lentithecium fluviatile CBS 122367]|uniref:Uncharacterized protein n=1 Tax=Lentithecium fluviatile CBS 122367 TaxID=1168545 RepID=A0A6G1JJE3_9PLEO|nr:hypothetical protein K458DRAFT_399676 [Lentithecium fluviatile CBS 122367]